MKRLHTKKSFFWDSVRILTRDKPIWLGNVKFWQIKGEIRFSPPQHQWNQKQVRKDFNQRTKGEP